MLHCVENRWMEFLRSPGVDSAGIPSLATLACPARRQSGRRRVGYPKSAITARHSFQYALQLVLPWRDSRRLLAETIESTVTVKALQGDKPIKTRKLGPVGGRIAAETFVGLLLANSSSYVSLNPLQESEKFKVNGVSALREMIKYAFVG
jgi:hypothetical protein